MPTPNDAALPLPDAMRRNLAELCWLRAVLAILLLLTALALHIAEDGLVVWPWGLPLVFALLVLINLMTWLRLRGSSPVDDDELFLQLFFDVVLLTLLFRLSGGSSNPFITYFLVPLAIAASTLPWRQTASLALLTLLAYSCLFWWPAAEAEKVPWPWLSYRGHLLGMWVNFAISSLLLVFFLGRMHRRLRAQDRHLAAQQRRQLQRDQAVAMGTLAAGAVHELATPLATMMLLAEEMADLPAPAADPASVRQLQAQLARCRDILARLREQARHPESLPARSLPDHVDNCLQPLHVLYPACRFSVNVDAPAHAAVALPWLLQQVLYNGLKNAAEAARAEVGLMVTLTDETLTCCIRDDGPGYGEDVLRGLERPATSGKPGGLGLGLFLAQLTLDELGGSLMLRNPPEGGAEMTFRIPRRQLQPAAAEG